MPEDIRQSASAVNVFWQSARNAKISSALERGSLSRVAKDSVFEMLITLLRRKRAARKQPAEEAQRRVRPRPKADARPALAEETVEAGARPPLAAVAQPTPAAEARPTHVVTGPSLTFPPEAGQAADAPLLQEEPGQLNVTSRIYNVL